MYLYWVRHCSRCGRYNCEQLCVCVCVCVCVCEAGDTTEQLCVCVCVHTCTLSCSMVSRCLPPVDCSPPGSSVLGSISFSIGSSLLGMKLVSPAFQEDSSGSEPALLDGQLSFSDSPVD